MGIPKEQLKKISKPLYGFTGDSVIPQGTIRLPITAGKKPRQATIMANFMVIKGCSQYNAVIGRPTLQALRAVTSIYHQKVKFPTPNGIGEIKSNQYEARVMYYDALRGYDQPGRVEVESFLKKNLDVFAWNHSDMEGIDLEVICHFLNIDPSYPPKCQKHRPMNPERYAALKEEVDKLINNGFVREAHYPRWVSNPVLVVKPNGTWRTCVDFSDLNKACPKDGFPLPRID
ncbi:uncharacterized protein LOC112090799 [Morus notabilis]|uniref:uncharacterized protein LOC112090799 n=1 Tax=Morus notabilis TaxID=981085 RepID=UPI000CED65D5|nr:uncharacterized protein LOC112090799 [Morus notabilis]